MTATTNVGPSRLLEEQLAQASPDLLRELLGTFLNTLLSAEADAEYGQTSLGWTNRRNGYLRPGAGADFGEEVAVDRQLLDYYASEGLPFWPTPSC